MSRQPALRIHIYLWAIILFLFISGAASAHEGGYAHPEKPADELVRTEKPSWGHRIVWYVPNRCLDIADTLRLRFRFGKGWAGNLRLGEPGTIFGGDYKTKFVGFPGPRYPERTKKFYGREEYKGLELSFVDATDEGPYEPNYTFSEFVIGAQLEYIGLDFGTDPFEWIDLVGGLLFFDPRGDDL